MSSTSLFTKIVNIHFFDRAHLHHLPIFSTIFLLRVYFTYLTYLTMRLLPWLSAACIILLNMSTATAQNITRPDPSPPHLLSHLIPDPTVGCTGVTLNPENLEVAKEKAVRWGRSHHVASRAFQQWSYGNATVWICNCKHAHPDPVREAELNSTFQILDEECGPNQSGWVWSKKWQKGFNRDDPSPWRYVKKAQFCPSFCIRRHNN